ncbi:MAG: CHRD domain-containing protein [bacterium]|nr:CHRD domain-containing protein [bacterium]
MKTGKMIGAMLLAVSLGIGSQATAAIWSMSATLNGAQEVPVNPSLGTGIGSFIIDDVANTVQYNIAFGGLTGTETAAHFHGYSAIGVNSGVRSALPVGSPKIGVWNANATDIANILAGMVYVNIHSNTSPGGEIRGQVINPTPLPVELSSFNAVSSANGILLTWRTETETGNDRFLLERKTEGEEYTTITSVNTLSSNGNSTTPLSYRFVDTRVVVGVTYSYRLVQIDVDGEVNVLRTVSATMQGSTTAIVEEFGLLNTYPNPFNPTTTIRVQLKTAGDANVAVYNMNGQLVQTLHQGNLSAGEHSFQFNAVGMASGNYLVKLTSGNVSNSKMISLVR